MVNFDNDRVETVRQAAKREQVEELLGVSTAARKSDKELFMNAYDAIPYKITGNVTGQGQIGLDFGDSPSDFAYLIYFPGGKSGYYQKSDAEQVSHEDFYEFYGIDEDSLDDDDFYDEEGASYSSKKTAAIAKQPFDLRPSSWNVDENGEGMFLTQAQESRWEEKNQPEQKQSGLIFTASKQVRAVSLQESIQACQFLITAVNQHTALDKRAQQTYVRYLSELQSVFENTWLD